MPNNDMKTERTSIILSYFYKYRVFKKEGEKVKDYYTAKKWILGAVKGFIVTVRMGHLINCIKLPKNFTL